MDLNRNIFQRLQENVQENKVLLLYGPRRVGKTFLLKKLIERFEQSESILFVSGENRVVRDSLSSENIEKLKLFLGDASLLIIDEAQKVPNIGVNLKLIIDHIPGIKVIASGSASFALAEAVGEPLTGRKKTMRLFPISVSEIVKNYDVVYQESLLEEEIIFGGYPELFSIASRLDKQEYLLELIDSILFRDILEIEKIKNSKILVDLLALLAFQIGKEVSINELSRSLGIHKTKVMTYLDVLEKSFIIINIRGFSRNLRNEITKNSRYYFYDNGIRNAIINNFNPLNLRDDIGMLWENFLTMERIKKQNDQRIHANNYFWRTYDQKEIDFIEERDGKLFGFEYKWGKKKASFPKIFLETYKNAELKIIDRDNYLDFLM